MASLAAYLLIFYAAFATGSSCGNYCGSWMCGGIIGNYTPCDFTVPPAEINGDSCTDSCCMEHDMCCDSDGRSECNGNMVQCLNDCGGLSASCFYGILPLSAPLLSTFFGLVEEWCCNKPCWLE